jgi:hypothetical protein
MTKIFNDKRGVSVYIAILVMTILMAIVFGLTSVVIKQAKEMREMGYSVVAYYAAETGIETALNDQNCTSSCPLTSGTLNISPTVNPGYQYQGFATSTPDCPDTANFCVKAVGTYGQTRRGLMIAR